MPRTLCLLVLSLALPGFSPAQEKPPALKGYAVKLQGRHAYGIYVRNQKLGWMVIDVKLGKHDGKEVLISVEEMRAELKRGFDSVKMEVKTTGIFGLDGAGEVLVYEERSKEGRRETVRRGERKGDDFTITTNGNGKGRTVKPPRRNLLATRKLDDWLRSDPKRGATLESFTITLEDADIDTQDVYTYKGKRTLTAGGVTSDVYQVAIRSKGAISDMEVLADGTPVKGTLAGFLELRPEPEATAKKLEAVNLDLLELASIPVDRELGDPGRVGTLRLIVTGLGDYPLPLTHRQLLKPGEEKGTHALILKRDFKADDAQPLTEAQKKKMLEATPTVQADEPKVKELAKTILGDETDIHKKAQKLSRHVYAKVRKSFSDNASTTLEVMERMAGDCTEHSLLFVSLARAAGIPAREVGGVGYAGPGSKSFGWHAWAEYHDGHQWVSIDPTWNQDRVDATHIKFSDSADDMTWVNVLGKVKFKVVDAKP